MQIICPYTKLSRATEMALKTEFRRLVDFVDVSGSEEAYFRLMYKYWKQGETFTVVEHDIVPWPGALKVIDECEQPLCAYQAPHGIFGDQTGYSFGLGLVKYGKELMEKYPNHLDEPSLTRQWHHLDGELTTRLNEAGIETHYHFPPVLHLSEQRFSHYIYDHSQPES